MALLAQIPAETEFFILRSDGMAEGPYVHAQLVELLAARRITPQTRLRPLGHDSWIPAFNVLEGTPELKLAASEPAGAQAESRPFHPQAPLAALIAGVVGLLAWMIPLIGLALTAYGGRQGLIVLRAGSRDLRALAGVPLCGVGFLLSVCNAVLGIWFVARG